MFDRETIYCPARLPSVVEKDIRNTCLLIYEVLNAKDYARIDMMLDDHLEPYFLELNTFAGLTMESQVAEDETMRLLSLIHISRLEDVVTRYKRYLEIASQIESSKEVLEKETDEEMLSLIHI